MTDDKLLRDEVRRAADYEAIESDIKREVAGEIAADAAGTQDGRIENVADDMRSKAVDEVMQTRHEVERGRIAARISQIVDYLFFLLYGLFAIRFLLELFAAREGVAFFRFITAVTDPFHMPFRGIFRNISTPEGFTVELSIVVAVIVYALLHMAINGFFRIIAHRKMEI